MLWNTYICGDFDARRAFDIFEKLPQRKVEIRRDVALKNMIKTPWSVLYFCVCVCSVH